MVKKCNKVGQNRDNHDMNKFGAQFPAKHDNNYGIHQMTINYKRNLQQKFIKFHGHDISHDRLFEKICSEGG